MNDGPAALKALAPLGENEAFKPLYFFHAGAINDYLGNTKAAAAHYTALMNIKHMELAVFPLQVIANFYLRQNEPDKALSATRNAVNKNNLMMKSVIEDPQKKRFVRCPGFEISRNRTVRRFVQHRPASATGQ